MKTRWMAAAAAAALLAALPTTAHADSPHQRLMDANAEAIVSVKMVLAAEISRGGQTQNHEFNTEGTGVIIDPAGLILMGASNFPQGRQGQAPFSMDIKTTPVSIRVIFPGDPEEYDAVLGATDTRIGLAFLRIKDLKGKEIRAVDTTHTADPEIGMHLYGVSRLPQGFDYAPYCDSVTVVGQVRKPRKMWLLQGRFTEEAHPLFTEDGRLAGFAVDQEGVGEGGSLPFLLPHGITQSTIERGGREAAKILEEALARDAEDAGKDGEKEAAPPSDDATEPPAPPSEPDDGADSGGE